MNEESAVGVEPIAKLLAVSPETVYRRARAGEIPGFKVGREWRFFPSKVIAFLEKPAPMWHRSNRSLGRKRVA